MDGIYVDDILSRLREIEQKYDVKILLAVGKEKDMSEVPQYLVGYYNPLAEYYSDIVGKFRPECNNEGVSERLNRFFYETVTGDKYDC